MKWLSVPCSIMAIFVATSALDLSHHWKSMIKYQKFDWLEHRNDFVLFAVLLGYLGATPGFMIYYQGTALSYGLAALLALIGYGGLGLCSSWTTPSEWLFFFTLVFLIVAAMSSAIAIVAAVCTPVENFTRKGSILLIVLLIGYFLIGYMFEESLRHSLFYWVKSKYYYPLFGLFVAVIYAICAGLVQEVSFDQRYEGSFASVDQLGSLMFILVELAVIITLYFVYLRNYWFGISLITIGCAILLNFILAGAMIGMANSSVKDSEILNSNPNSSDEKVVVKEVDDYIFTPKLYWMLFGTLCLVGVTSVCIYNLDKIIFSTKTMTVSLNGYYSTIILTQSISALVVGLISYFLRNTLNEYIFMILGGVIALIGLLLILFAYLFAPKLLFYGVVLISIASGIAWVMPSMIAYDDAGSQPFGIAFSLILLANWWGMCTFGFTLKFFGMQIAKPFIPTMVAFFVGVVASIVGNIVALTMDDK